MRNPLVLVVDDEPANRAFVRGVLKASGWTVAEATNGSEALDIVRSSLPDLIIMDIDMPGMDGWAATNALREADAPLPGVPILAYTTMRLDLREIRAGGMDGRLPKPCTPEELVTAVAPWRPDGDMSRTLQLGEVFGADEIERLVIRFRGQLIEALAALDTNSVEVPAHRIAGVAGTLGFADVSASWLRLSEGDLSVSDEAHRDARLAIAAIDRTFPRK